MNIFWRGLAAGVGIAALACSADPDETTLYPDSGLAFDTGAAPGPDAGPDAQVDAAVMGDAGPSFTPWVRSFGGAQDDMILGFVLREDRICAVGTIDAASVSKPVAVDLLGTPLVPRDGQADLFVGCFDYEGELLWVRTIGANGDDNFPRIISTDDGFVVSFDFSGGASIYPMGDGAATTLLGASLGDVGLAKFGFDGELLWARTLGVGGGPHAVASIVPAPSGDIFVVTSFALQFEEASLSTAGFMDQDILVLRLEGLAGDLVWARAFGSTSSDLSAIEQPSSATTDLAGNVYIAGHHSLTVSETGFTHTVPGGGTDAFVFSLDADGNNRWFQAWDNTNTALQIRTAPTGELYAVGDADQGETADIGGELLSVGNNTDLWVARLNPETGAALWARMLDIDSTGLPSSYFAPWPRLATAATGDVAICAWAGRMGVVYGELTVASDGLDDPFFLHLDSAGDAVGLQLIDSASSLWIYDMQFGPDNTLVIGGAHYSDPDAGVTTVVDPLVNNGRADGFLARYRPWE